MKTTLVIISLLILIPVGLFSQQLEQYTHATFNYFGVNPAVAGSKPCLDLRLGYRTQWVGFEGAPTTAFINAHTKLGKTRKNNIHGFGASLLNDQTGPYSFAKLQLAYAFNFRLSQGDRLAFGVSAGIQQARLNTNELTSFDFGEDPLLGASQAEFLYPMVDFGVLWYNKTKFVGLSIKNLVEREFNELGGALSVGGAKRHFYLSGGTSVEIGDNFYFRPSLHTRFTGGAPFAVDLNLILDYNDLVAIGLVARNQNGFSALLRVSAFDYISIGYAYDYTISKIKFGGQNTHEVILGILACPKNPQKSVPCAAYY